MLAPLIAVVDDDNSVRESLDSLIRAAGLNVGVFTSAEEFLSSGDLPKVACLVLDVRMPGMSGIELHRHLLSKGYRVPVILMTAYESDEEAGAQASSFGAVAYLKKPFDEGELLGAIRRSLKSDSKRKGQTLY